MSTAVVPEAVAVEQRVLLHNVRWETYLGLLAAAGNDHTRLTYDRGDLEIMAPLYRHERIGNRFDRLIGILAEELNITFTPAGSTTFKREDLQRGLEPDECYYFRNASLLLGKEEIDLSVDPPPDLAIEVDITHRSLDRMSIYAALGVPELWRFENDRLHVYQLGADGQYAPAAESLSLPGVPLTEVAKFVTQFAVTDELTLIRTFRAWVRKDVLPHWRGTAQGS